ncbi:hypothetical protein DVH26_07795 [Paenibacillus sp. H1-7]|uniref:hypothetical protein n=1 Tax=Paenibacillus sp. H1-7 TaxID=2282849 RepID=UPI001EF7E5D4|nr:hypothetical protein [Paenibacillus sp. H1-7]ULL14360.1 hypothetical protein DVH26_07795 [Paenibacillus sp. H1-7]
MRKYIIGAVVGASITLSINVSAAVDSIIGKSVEGEFSVVLDGKELGSKAAVVNGTSYLPVRAVGETMGLNVSYQDNKVVLNDNRTEEARPLLIKEKTAQDYDKAIQIKKRQIPVIELQIKELRALHPEETDKIKQFEAKLQEYNDEIAGLEKQKAEISQP